MPTSPRFGSTSRVSVVPAGVLTKICIDIAQAGEVRQMATSSTDRVLSIGGLFFVCCLHCAGLLREPGGERH